MSTSTAYAMLLTVPLSFVVALLLFLVTLRRVRDTVGRIEAAAQLVAVDLAGTAVDLRKAAAQRITMTETLDRMERATDVVAHDLAESIARADAAHGPEGAAADAALRTGHRD